MNSSITDTPKKAGKKDSFGIEPFENGLINFIENTNTPITIALQGEWGSGKTSLMNSLQAKLCEDGKKFHPIWLNTWQYSLMKEADTALVSIIKGLTEEVLSVKMKDSNVLKEASEKLSKIFGKVFSASTKIAIKATTGQDVSEVFDAFSTENKESTILELRNELNETIKLILKEGDRDGFIFFIDDLDRIDPPVAVQILELLKNIFDLDHCIFVLSIDYDVVIKGLEPKFGKLTEKNEREFRSFFDKIIQLPFSMPVNSYKIDGFLKESLLSINYLTEQQTKDLELLKKLTEIANLSVGTNPRALKRLMNSLSLISCINKAKGARVEDDQLNENLELIVNFALVSIQIAFPAVYRLLSVKSGFDKWDNSVALQFNLKELDNLSKEKLSKSEAFDEEWEQVLFQLCENDHFLKKKALNISRLLNSLKVSIQEKDENVEDIVEAVISLSSVTNLEAFDQAEVDYHRGWFLKTIRNKFLPKLKVALPDNSNFIAQLGTRVQSNFRFKLNENGHHNFSFKSHPHGGKVRLIISTWLWLTEANNTNLKACLKEAGQSEAFEKIELEYNGFIQNHPKFKALNLCDEVIKSENTFYVLPHTYLTLPTVEDFYKDENIDALVLMIVEKYRIISQLYPLGKKMGEYYKSINNNV